MINPSSSVETEARPEELQRFIELGRLSASLLHEISSPLTAALIHLEDVNDQKSLSVRAIRRSLVRVSRYVNAARKQLRNQGELTIFSLDSQVRDIKRLVLPLAKVKHVKLDFSLTPKAKLRGDPIKFQQILVNLIVNAIEAYDLSQTQTANLRVRVVISDQLKYIQLVVIDWGEGISQAQLPRLFDPFYSTKSGEDKGLGLGLVIVKQCVKDSFNGSINVTSSARNGTCFTIKLPKDVRKLT